MCKGSRLATALSRLNQNTIDQQEPCRDSTRNKTYNFNCKDAEITCHLKNYSELII